MTARHLTTESVRRHFDSIADTFDIAKRKNWYYYGALKRTVAEIIPPGKRVLDIGTGTGEILNYLRPSLGIGIDISSKLIEKAKSKFPQFQFFASSYEDFNTKETFDYVFLADVLVLLERPEKLFWHLRRFCAAGTTVVITMANPAWEPVLKLLDRLKLKLDEERNPVPEKAVLRYAASENFELLSNHSGMLLPLYIPLVSDIANRVLAELPLLKRLALIKRYVFRPPV